SGSARTPSWRSSIAPVEVQSGALQSVPSQREITPWLARLARCRARLTATVSRRPPWRHPPHALLRDARGSDRSSQESGRSVRQRDKGSCGDTNSAHSDYTLDCYGDLVRRV